MSVENEPLFAPPTYSGMQMLATEQAAFFGNDLAPAMAAAGLKTKVMAYDYNWDRPDYPETVLERPQSSSPGRRNRLAPLQGRAIGDDEIPRRVSAKRSMGD